MGRVVHAAGRMAEAPAGTLMSAVGRKQTVCFRAGERKSEPSRYVAPAHDGLTRLGARRTCSL